MVMYRMERIDVLCSGETEMNRAFCITERGGRTNLMYSMFVDTARLSIIEEQITELS